MKPRKPSCATTKLTPFVVRQDEWDTKENTGKSMKNALYILRCAKGISQAEATSNSEQNKPIALAIIKIHLSEGIGQLLNQSVENSI